MYSYWTQGFSTFTDQLQRIKADLEQNIESSLHSDQRARLPDEPAQQSAAQTQPAGEDAAGALRLGA